MTEITITFQQSGNHENEILDVMWTALHYYVDLDERARLRIARYIAERAEAEVEWGSEKEPTHE